MALGVLGLATWRLAGQRPPWWANLTRRAGELNDQAERIENIVTTELHRADRAEQSGETYTSTPWTLRLSDAEANAWLNTRLPRWAENRLENFRWPTEIAELQVSFAPGSIRVGGALRSLDRIISAGLTPSVREDGSVWLASRWMHVGRLPVPATWVLGRLQHAQAGAQTKGQPPSHAHGDALAQIALTLAGDRPVLREPIVRLADGRRVRILSIELGEGTLTLTCQTEFGGE